MILLNDIDRIIEDGDEVREYPESHHWVEDREIVLDWWRENRELYLNDTKRC